MEKSTKETKGGCSRKEKKKEEKRKIIGTKYFTKQGREKL